MQASLKSALANFSQDFDQALTHAYLSFQTDAKTLRERDWQDYSNSYDQWLKTAAYPDLVTGIFLIEPGLRLSRFNRAASGFEAADWPSELEAFKQRFDKAFKAERDPTRSLPTASVDTLSDDIPALAIPVPDAELFDKQELPPSVAFSGYILVLLDLDFIKQQFIPALSARYFASSDGMDCTLAITSRSDPETVIYKSDPNFSEKSDSTADATANIFDVRVNMSGLSKGIAREVETSDKIVTKHGNVKVQFLNTVVKKGSESQAAVPRIALISGEGGRWQVMLKHRAGSLDLAVTNTRRRNLAISFGILLLLAASVAMIVISTRRAGKLARQQMEFVAGVSHEMRTPLAVICSAGENLADGVIDDRRQVQRYGALIESEGRRLSQMIEQALEFAGLQSGRKTYALQTVDPASAIESAIAASEPLIREGGFKIEKEIAADLPAIQADGEALSRSIQNLLSNAMKYSGESLWIRIKAERVAAERGDEARITVEDRGLGIAPSELGRIFEPFYRGREVTAAQIHGSGLGLSLVKRIIEAHGGRVSVQSSEREGSAFTLHLPAKKATSDQQATVGD